MAEVLKNHAFSKRGNVEGYPYDQWLDGQIWKIIKDTDFNCNVQSMRVNLYNAARSRRIQIRTKTGPDHVIVQRIN